MMQIVRLNRAPKKRKNTGQNNKRAGETGNVFIFILLGIALFAALGLTVSRGMRSQTTTTLSDRDAQLAASDILSYAQRMARSVDRIRRNGVSENDISFANAVVTGYAHTVPQVDEHKVFHPSGAGMTWSSPAQNTNDGSEWIVTGETCIADVGSGATGCDSDSSSNEELLLVLPAVNASVCEAINAMLGIDTIPADSGGGASTTKFKGEYDDGTEIIPAGGSFESACVSGAGTYTFYATLIAR